MNGWIKIHRQLLEWEWYNDINTFRLFMHILLKAQHKPIDWQGIKIEAGSFVTSLDKLSKETGLSIRKVRTALDNLKTTREVTSKTTSRYSIVTVNNWNKWQTNDTPLDKQTTCLCYNKNERIEEESSSSKTTNNVVSLSSSLYKGYGSYSNVYLSKVQYGTLTQLMGGEELLTVFIDELSENIASKKEQVFDEKYPNMHFIRLRKYFKAHQSNRKEQPNEPRPYNPYL
ncbi:MAG: hypothetical protein II234_00035 [Clostridia bacterium]|nr:hypothetical protein [Clostridia bacterium]